MLKLWLISADGVKTALPAPVSFEINRELGAADDMTLELPYCDIPERCGCEIELEYDGSLIFTGIIDELRQLESGSGAAVTIYARSKAALLLDNEAKACDYKNADARLIAREHIEPFGLGFVCRDSGEYADMRIYKGLSHWQVIKSFCSQCYSRLPYLDESGRVILCSDDAPSLYFCNDGGIKYTSALLSRRYYKLISSVHTKPPEHDDYDIETTNPIAERLGIVRTRFVDGSVSGVSYGEKLISDGNAESLQIKISSPEFIRCPLGSSIKITLGGGDTFDGLICSRVKQSLGSNGFSTAITAAGKIKINE